MDTLAIVGLYLTELRSVILRFGATENKLNARILLKEKDINLCMICHGEPSQILPTVTG